MSSISNKQEFGLSEHPVIEEKQVEKKLVYDQMGEYQCPECEEQTIPIVDKEMGEVICSKCGLVIKDKIEVPSWEQEQIPTVDPLSLANPDSYIFEMKRGNWVTSGILKRIIFSRTEWHMRKTALPKLSSICDMLSTPVHIRRYAAAIYYKIYESSLIHKGVDHEPYVIASLILSYRYHKIAINENLILNNPYVYSPMRSVRNAIKRIIVEKIENIQVTSAKAYLPLVLASVNAGERETLGYSENPKTVLEELKKRQAMDKASHDLLDSIIADKGLRVRYVSGKNPWVVATSIVRVVSKITGVKVPLSSLANVSYLTIENISKNSKKLETEIRDNLLLKVYL